jgi:hypothetical protein
VRGKAGSEKRKAALEGKVETGMQKMLKVMENTSKPEMELSLGGVGKPLSLQPASKSQSKDRGLVPPAMPVPIASFTI